MLSNRVHYEAGVFLVLLAMLMLSLPVGLLYKACSKPDRAKAVAFAKDVRDALVRAEPYVVNALNAKGKQALAASFTKIVPYGSRLLVAVEGSDGATALEVIADIVPVFNAIAAEFTNDIAVLSILALADIGLHFLASHLVKAAESANTSISNTVQEFARQQVWGCAYHPKKCEGLK